ncbi:MAG: GNAT family N-acetyltransferase [Bacteroidetes bacterium]|nr:GNAT family N-acetyltransferase [Bacteroidota bacterium]
MYTIRTFTYGSADYKQAVDLRYKELRAPLGLLFTNAELQKDEPDVHMGLFDENNNILVCLTLTDTGNSKLKVRQVATDSNQQGKGLGRKLSDAAEEYAKQHGYLTMYCHARKVASPFYLKLGYKIVSDEFTEVGIPHYVMEKTL